MFESKPLAQAVRAAQRPLRRAAWPLIGAAAMSAVVLGVQTSGVATAALSTTSTLSQPAMPASFADLVDATRPSVVGIMTRGSTPQARGVPQPPAELPFGHPFRRFFEDDSARAVRGMGSGFVIDPDGLVVTNHHVIAGATEVTVVLHDGRELPATVRGSDPKTDLAVLEVKSDEPLAAARFGDSDKARVGDWVVAVGSPFGLGGSYTAGIISARGRDINSGPYDDFLQIDAPINRGNSGGALFNTAGEVIGINTAIFSPNGGNVGIGFAVPAKIARAVITDLSDDGLVDRGWLGVQIQALNDAIAKSLGLESTAGALVAGVEPGGPAGIAGIEVGDVVLAVNGDDVERFRDLPRLVAAVKTGKRVPVVVWRHGKRVTVDVEMGAQQRDTVANAEGADTARMGLSLAAMDERTRQRFNLGPDVRGVVIVDIREGSAAARTGLRPGMVIEMVSQRRVDTPQAVAATVAAARAEKHDAVLLLVTDARGIRRFVPLAVS